MYNNIVKGDMTMKKELPIEMDKIEYPPEIETLISDYMNGKVKTTTKKRNDKKGQ